MGISISKLPEDGTEAPTHVGAFEILLNIVIYICPLLVQVMNNNHLDLVYWLAVCVFVCVWVWCVLTF